MDTSPLQTADETPKITMANDYSEFYFNHVQVGYTIFDIYAYLGNMRLTHDGKPALVQRARVITSPLEAKLFHSFLGNAIQQYEQRHGEIPIPASAMEEDA